MSRRHSRYTCVLRLYYFPASLSPIDPIAVWPFVTSHLAPQTQPDTSTRRPTTNKMHASFVVWLIAVHSYRFFMALEIISYSLWSRAYHLNIWICGGSRIFRQWKSFARIISFTIFMRFRCEIHRSSLQASVRSFDISKLNHLVSLPKKKGSTTMSTPIC